jgi:hypothetical protein
MEENTALVKGLMNVEAWNDQFRQPNPKGKYPICEPSLGANPHCIRCNWPILPNMANRPPCPAVPEENRWGEDFKP